jgi:hypothetical protein
MTKLKKRKNRKRKRHQSKAVRISLPVLQDVSEPLPLPARASVFRRSSANRLPIHIDWQSLLAFCNVCWKKITLWTARLGQAPLWLTLGLALSLGLLLFWPHKAPLRLILPGPEILAKAYPEAISLLRQTPDGWLIRFQDGSEEWYLDRRSRSWPEMIDQPDLASVLAQSYPFGPVPLPRPVGQDPGRVRHYGLLGAAYGHTPQEVRRNLEVVDFYGDAVWFNRRNGAAEALRRVVQDIAADPEVSAYIINIARHHWRKFTKGKTAGLYQGRYITDWEWRRVAGTQRLSAHSFGIAVDINNPYTRLPKYWGWKYDFSGRIEAVPWRLVEIFEQNGFIWGGKWFHFDTMHFEYRPEFLAASQREKSPNQAQTTLVPFLKAVAPHTKKREN